MQISAKLCIYYDKYLINARSEHTTLYIYTSLYLYIFCISNTYSNYCVISLIIISIYTYLYIIILIY